MQLGIGGLGFAEELVFITTDSLAAASVSELLCGFGTILEELRSREIVRSANNPVSDYAEILFSRAYRWHRGNNSIAGFDATDENGIRYQIKARRLTRHNGSRQLGALRKMNAPAPPFDHLAGVLFKEDFQVIRAAIIPFNIVRTQCTYVTHSNSWRFLLRDRIWTLPGVQDVTASLREASAHF